MDNNEIAKIIKDTTQTLQPQKDFSAAVSDVKLNIITRAQEKINDDKTVEKHAKKMAEIADKSLDVESEKQRLRVEQVDADNKVQAREIKNRLIVLRNEGRRLEKEQAQLNREQKIEHRHREKDAKWRIYGQKLTEMGYTYVPNIILLNILMFFYGAKEFVNGLNKLGNAIVRCFKWVLIIGLIFAILMIIPVTREWLLTLLGFASK